jgi:hypothetical protein
METEAYRFIRDDLNGLRSEVQTLRERRASAETAQEILASQVAELIKATGELKGTIDRSRGALWVLSSMSGGVGAVVGAITAWALHK